MVASIFLTGRVTVKKNQITPKMNAQLAEQLVEKWQTAKAHALGQDHAVEELSEVICPILLIFSSSIKI